MDLNMKIIDFIKSLLPRMNKSSILEDMRITNTELDTIVIPSYSAGTAHFKSNKIKSPVIKDLANVFYRNATLIGGKKSSLVEDIYRQLPNLKENSEYIQSQIELLLEKDILSQGLTAKKAILIRAAESISFISKYSLDLLNYIYVNEAIELNTEVEEAFKLSPVAIKHIKDKIADFALLLTEYSAPNDKLANAITSIPEVIVNSKTASAVSGVYKDTDLDPFSGYANNFTYNPIYHLRMCIAESQAARYKANKEKKKVLELRLLHLKMLNEDKQDPKIEQEIEYNQSRVDKIERQMKEIEESMELT